MKKLNIKSSLLLDALLSLSIMTSLCITYIPMVNHMSNQIKHKENEINMKRILVSALSLKNQKEDFNFTIDHRFKINFNKYSYCIFD
ncbi:hypothetical protein MHZ36_04920, partial [Staphylococcus sp. ACRSN]|nr:hypothetical protein [Staphylococcus sp. ACRSN]